MGLFSKWYEYNEERRKENHAYDEECYLKLVRTHAIGASKDILPSAGVAHMEMAISELFKTAKHHIKIVINDLDEKYVGKDFLLNLGDAMRRSVTVEVISLNLINKSSKLFNLLNDNGGVIKEASGAFIKRLTKEGGERHFMVIDFDKFLFEQDSDKNNAWFSFNDVKNTQILNKVFNEEFITGVMV